MMGIWITYKPLALAHVAIPARQFGIAFRMGGPVGSLRLLIEVSLNNDAFLVQNQY
jgi:hypothetical protein